ncbi:MAG TPA: serine hydrolase domain-containing protein [Stellaceae bacterium]
MSQIVETKPEQVGLSSERLARIRPWMEKLVADNKLPGVLTVVARRGKAAYCDMVGYRDVAAKAPVTEDTVYRIYSMTKAITSTAIMMLYEEGKFQLDDPISHYLPMFKDMRVYAGGTPEKYDTVAAKSPITFKQLLTHTSGLTYGFTGSPVSAIYQAAKFDFQTEEASLWQMMERLAKLPLLAQPGTEWNYSVSTDVLGALVETISGMGFDQFLKTRIFDPLGMKDTGFTVREDQRARFAANYEKAKGGGMNLIEGPGNARYFGKQVLCSGGGGLVSTAGDYLKFCKMIAGKGALGNVRILGRKTVEFMRMNHLQTGGDLASMGMPRFSESTMTGIGFGLGFAVVLDPAKAELLCSPAEHYWGGAASTAFWIDPVEDIVAILMTQLMPSSSYPIRRELRVLVNQAIVD